MTNAPVFAQTDVLVTKRIELLTRKRRRKKIMYNLFYLFQFMATISIMLTILFVPTTQYVYSTISVVLPLVIQAVHFFFPVEGKIAAYDIAIAQYKNIRFYLLPNSVETTQMSTETLYNDIQQRLAEIEKIVPEFPLVPMPALNKHAQRSVPVHRFETERINRELLDAV